MTSNTFLKNLMIGFLTLLIFSGSLYSSAAHAASKKLLEECRVTAAEKLMVKAALFEAVLDEASVEILDEKKDILHGVHTIWFKAQATTRTGKTIFISTNLDKEFRPLKNDSSWK